MFDQIIILSSKYNGFCINYTFPTTVLETITTILVLLLVLHSITISISEKYHAPNPSTCLNDH